MTSEGRQIPQNTGVLDEDEIINGETTPAGTYGKTEDGVPEGAPPAGRGAAGASRRPEGLDESHVRSTHPDGPGVGGD
ncbi:MAG: hypothetical protein ACK47B_26875 [Armatimonadota bacterium]